MKSPGIEHRLKFREARRVGKVAGNEIDGVEESRVRFLVEYGIQVKSTHVTIVAALLTMSDENVQSDRSD